MFGDGIERLAILLIIVSNDEFGQRAIRRRLSQLLRRPEFVGVTRHIEVNDASGMQLNAAQ